MPKTVSVYTADKFLFQKILLDAPEGVEVTPYGVGDFDICLWDVDTGAEAPVGSVTMSRNGKGNVSLPFPLGTVEKILRSREKESALLSISRNGRCAYLSGEKIKLTDLEFALLSAIAERGGSYASREELLSEVWGDKAESGILNVYVHYLREKLEKRGEKIILSSRKHGYKIAEKYLGGDA